jgi:predicted nucleic acid-binding Zn ribbon protein
MNNQNFCPMCGQSVEAGDAFCQSCGERLKGPINTGRENKNRFARNKWIAIIAVVIIVAGSITAYSLLGKAYSAESVIRDTLALESGKIEISVGMGYGGYYESESMDVKFIKNKREKTYLFESDSEIMFVSAKDGKVQVVDNWSDEEFDYDDMLGLDVDHLEKDLINFFANSFKGKKLPEQYIEDLEIQKSGKEIVISGDFEDEYGLISWIYESLDMDELRDLIAERITADNDDADYYKESLRRAMDNMDDVIAGGLQQLDTAIDYNYNVDTSFKIIVDENGILDQVSVVMEIVDLDWGQSGEFTLDIEFADKNNISKIRKP